MIPDGLRSSGSGPGHQVAGIVHRKGAVAITGEIPHDVTTLLAIRVAPRSPPLAVVDWASRWPPPASAGSAGNPACHRLDYFTTDVNALFEAMDIIGERLGAVPVASTLLGMTRLALPEMMIEIEATAVA